MKNSPKQHALRVFGQINIITDNEYTYSVTVTTRRNPPVEAPAAGRF